MSFVEEGIGLAWVGFDTETTGLDVSKDRIVSAALVGVDASGKELVRREWLVDPGILIPREATRIHGITTERAVAEGREAAEAVGEIADCLEGVLEANLALVVQNAPYDLSLLSAEARRYGLAPLEERRPVAPVLDPVMLAKVAQIPGRHSLAVLCERFAVVNSRAHTAYADAVTTLEVLRRLLVAEDLEEEHPMVLHGMQLSVAERRAASWQEELRGGDPCARVSAGWPVSTGRTRLGCMCRDCGRLLEDDELEQPCAECRTPGAAFAE